MASPDLRSAPVHRFHEDSSYTQERLPDVNEALPRPGPRSGGQSLPAPSRPLLMPLGEALRRRRSCRQFQPHPVDMKVVSGLLAAAAGAVHTPDEPGAPRRTYPAAGALYCIHVYLVALRVEGLAEGVYRYQAEDHTLHRVEPGGFSVRERLQQMLGIPGFDSGAATAAALVLLTAELPLITSRYGARGYRFALQESGHLAQNLLLAAAAEGLGALPLGNFLDDCAAEVVGTDAAREPVLYVVAVGHAMELPHQDIALAVPPHLVSPQPWLQWRLSAASPKQLLTGPLSLTLQEMEEQGQLLGFWFMVKMEGGGHLRLRVLPGQLSPPRVAERLEQVYAEAQRQQQLTHAQSTLYEPETFLFGGLRGMDLCHTLFCLDSRLVMETFRVERRLADQLSQTWTALVLRSAGLDPFERWDVWKRVGRMRPAASPQMRPLLEKMRPALRQLEEAPTPVLQRRIETAAPSLGALCARLEGWGEQLREAQRGGDLERGVRQILAATILFHWNRMMYLLQEQVFLAALWQEATEPSP